MVKPLGGAGKDGAGFFGVVANGDDVVKMLAVELFDVFGAMVANIDADLFHRSDGLGTDHTGFGTGAFNTELIASVMAEQALCHLAASGVASAEDENALFIPHELL